MSRLAVVGDALLDRDLDGRVERLCPDAPVPVVDDPAARARPGGAALAAALAAASSEATMTLVSAVGDDAAGRELADLLAQAGVRLIDLGLAGRTPEKVRVRSDGRSLLRLDYGGTPVPPGALTAEAEVALRECDAVLVSDYGRGVTADGRLRAALTAIARGTPVVWDPHPRGSQPVAGARLVTPSDAEAEMLAGAVAGSGLRRRAAQAIQLRQRWKAHAVAVTLGPAGALLLGPDETPMIVPAPDGTEPVDPCGAGDCFASSAALSLARGELPSEAVVQAVAEASAFVRAGGAARFVNTARASTGPKARKAVDCQPSVTEVVAAVRARGGVLVATGGCFDLLHAGHVHMLSAARRLGDCLVVCINSDASVRRLKGADRPLVSQADRVAVLAGLGCVDAVEIFEEDTPHEVLRRLQPDIWVKGADYAVRDLPEADLVSSWGGTAVVVPYLAGRSTSELIKEATRRALV